MVKLKETNLDGVKAMARTLLFTDIHKTSLSPIVVQHPFTSSGFNMVMINGEPKCVDITADSEALHQWRKMVCEQIDSSKSAFEIYMMTNKKNTGEAPMYYVHNNHPAIVSREIFNKVQEEMTRRKVIVPASKKQSVTATGRYSKFALSDVLKCGECGSRYRRVTWSKKGKKKIVWRCTNRLDFGTKYCEKSPTLEEELLQQAIVRGIRKFNQQDAGLYLSMMKATIGEAIGIDGSSDEVDLLQRRIDTLNAKMLNMVTESVKSGADIESNEDEFKSISEEIEQLKSRIKAIQESICVDEDYESRVARLRTMIDEREKNPDKYDDSIVRQMIECIKVYHDGRIEIIFGGGYTVEENFETE